jgi:hypothetical protein
LETPKAIVGNFSQGRRFGMLGINDRKLTRRDRSFQPLFLILMGLDQCLSQID